MREEQAGLPRLTVPTQRVMLTLLEHPGQEMYGFQICKYARLALGTTRPILARLEGLGWLESRWEEAGAKGRARRHYYRLTASGTERVRAALVQATPPVTTARTQDPAGAERCLVCGTTLPDRRSAEWRPGRPGRPPTGPPLTIPMSRRLSARITAAALPGESLADTAGRLLLDMTSAPVARQGTDHRR